ncbi:MAG: DNA polymerase Y family protein [Acidimicrobiales bacterium]
MRTSPSRTSPSRALVVFCPDWPVVAAGLRERPAAVLSANRVVATSPSARAGGVRLGQTRRQAEASCPGLLTAKKDPVGEVAAFEPVVAAVGELTSKLEVTRPGVCSLLARGPARYFGGEEKLSARLCSAVSESCGVECRIGIADTAFAALLAAKRGLILPPGGTTKWLAGLPIGVLGPPRLTELLARLGIGRVGDLARLDEGVVGSRFGREGITAHQMARGIETATLALREPPADLVVQRDLDSPALGLDVVTFVASGAAEELYSRLAPRGLACTRLLVEAETEHGEGLARWWRADRPFTSRSMVDRVRWQLEGWLLSPGAPTGGITLVRLTAGEVAPDAGRQLGTFGDPPGRNERVERQAARIQGLLGHGAVGTAVLAGGRSLVDEARIVPFGEARQEPAGSRQPWPGRMPSPAPSIVHREPVIVEVRGEGRRPVGVTARGQLTLVPRSVAIGGELEIVAWAGPWPAEERWWDPSSHRRSARLQVELEDGSAHLLVLEHGRWAIEATYD